MGLRILVVDDHALSAQILMELLELRGHCTAWAQSGEEALQILAAKPFDLTLMDLHMPGMDGFETARWIRKELACGALVILAVTGDGEDWQSEAIEAGMNGVLTKPVDIQKMEESVMEIAGAFG